MKIDYGSDKVEQVEILVKEQDFDIIWIEADEKETTVAFQKDTDPMETSDTWTIPEGDRLQVAVNGGLMMVTWTSPDKVNGGDTFVISCAIPLDKVKKMQAGDHLY